MNDFGGNINPPTKPRAEMSKRLASDVERFLAKGGKIEEVPIGVTNDVNLMHMHPQCRSVAVARAKHARSVKLGARIANRARKGKE